MKDWKKTFINPNDTIKRAMLAIQQSSAQLALVIDKEKKLLGTVTDGDIRTFLLNGGNIDAPVEKIMYRQPTFVLAGTPKEEIIAIMKNKTLHQIPVVNAQGIVIGLELLNEYLQIPKLDNPIVIMAGGLGSRLRPLTEECPKPLLNIGGKPILEWIIEGFLQYGFYKFHLAINYKGHMIEDYFQDGSKWGAQISYLKETSRLGTAGALRLLKERPEQPFFVINGDLLTKINFLHMLDFHKTKNSCATVCVQNYEIRVPYGVIETKKGEIVKLVEKPAYNYLINSGIYILDPRSLDYLPQEEYIDFPHLIQKMIDQGEKPHCFSANGFWLDIGVKEDLDRANEEILDFFFPNSEHLQ